MTGDGLLVRGADVVFGEWVAPHLPTMRRYAAVLVPRRDPDDVVQDALERAWRRWDTYRPDRGSPRTWLLAIVADRARRSRVRGGVELAELTDLPAGSADVETRLDLRAAVTALPRRQREAVVLHYYVGLTVNETADLMGCAAGTVKSTLSDARAALARSLAEEDA